MTDQDNDNQSGVELAYASLAVFADDGKLDMEELKFLLGLATRDGEIDDSEKAVLAGVFNRVLEHEVEAEVWERIQNLRHRHGI